MTIVTRFAPSPTGFLHIGGARTALFNYLFARRHGGTFLLRIEDTDRERSTDAAVDAILDGLKWLGLEWDGAPISQFARRARHAAVVDAMLAAGNAYRCYCSAEELDEMRAKAKAEGKPVRYDGRWRDRDPAEAPAGIKPVIRLKAPLDGETVVVDRVQGEVRVENRQLDDMVLLRSDGTPTYMLAVVVDDHDMGVTHIIRGDDHLTNAFRQRQIYDAMGWTVPEFAHIPLIHGPDGAKLSKRHGALGIEAYREMGYLPQTLRNYLLRLGWGHGDEEIIPDARALEVFDLEGIGRAPSRLDFAKLDHVNAVYLRQLDDEALTAAAWERLQTLPGLVLDDAARTVVRAAIGGFRERVKTVKELAESAIFLVHPLPLPLNDKAKALLGGDAPALLQALADALAALPDWTAAEIEQAARTLAEARAVKLGAVAQPFRAALSGSNVSPPIFEIAEILGREAVLARIKSATGKTE
jgi:glutamyl-tRNA synthetase